MGATSIRKGDAVLTDDNIVKMSLILQIKRLAAELNAAGYGKIKISRQRVKTYSIVPDKIDRRRKVV